MAPCLEDLLDRALFGPQLGFTDWGDGRGIATIFQGGCGAIVVELWASSWCHVTAV